MAQRLFTGIPGLIWLILLASFLTAMQVSATSLIPVDLHKPVPSAIARQSLANSPWPRFRHDQAQSGRSPYTGPSVPARKWALIMDYIYASAAIGADGTIY